MLCLITECLILKSLGVEWIAEQLEPLLASYDQEKTEDLMHTYSVHLATQILKVLPRFWEDIIHRGRHT